MVGEFGDRLGETCVYPNFVHLLETLMRSMYKALMDEFRRYILAHYITTW